MSDSGWPVRFLFVPVITSLASAKAGLEHLSEAAEAAMAKRERAELEAADANVRCQRELLKRGVAGKSDLDRAEEKLAELKAQKN
jgi:hypothetical protein